MTTYGRFGAHIDPLTDYRVEVTFINAMVNEHIRDEERGCESEWSRDIINERIDKAWLNVVQPEWVEVKNVLREIDAHWREFLDNPTPAAE